MLQQRKPYTVPPAMKPPAASPLTKPYQLIHYTTSRGRRTKVRYLENGPICGILSRNQQEFRDGAAKCCKWIVVIDYPIPLVWQLISFHFLNCHSG